MRSKIQNLWDDLRTRLWFIPTVLVLCAGVVSSVLIEVDVALIGQRNPIIPWLFSGTADAARTMLSVIAGSLITVISVAFSITIVALGQVSAQYGPRVLGQLTANRGNQIVLGTYTATFVYALLVLRSIRSEQEDGMGGFVPALSVTAGLILALVCLGLLIYFIHHMSLALQVSTIIDGIHRDLTYQIDHLYPSRIGKADRDAPPAARLIGELTRTGEPRYIYANDSGFVRRVDREQLLELPLEGVQWLWIRPKIGEFVTEGGILAELDGRAADHAELSESIHNTIVIDRERSMTQDVLFGIRQLADIALLALSPGVNDPTTAEYVLAHLGAALGRIADRGLPEAARRTKDEKTLLIFSRPTWDEFVDTAFSQIRRAAADDVHVTGTLLDVLCGLAIRVAGTERGEGLQKQLAAIRRNIQTGEFDIEDQSELYAKATAVERALAGDPPHAMVSPAAAPAVR